MTIRTALVKIPKDSLQEPFGAPINIIEAEQHLIDYLEGSALDYKRISQGRFYKINGETVFFKFRISACNSTLIEMWRDGYLAEMRSPIKHGD